LFCFFFFEVDRCRGTGHVSLLPWREMGVRSRAEFWCEQTSGELFTFLATFSLQNRLLEIP